MKIQTLTSPDTKDLGSYFRYFGEVECPHDPVYFAICLIVADDPNLQALLDVAAPTQRRPNLLLAAIHNLVLTEARDNELAQYFPSAGGTRMPDDDLAPTLRKFADQWRAALSEIIRSNTTQTNETGRCAVLWPLLRHVSRLANNRPLALIDFGCSAGLNLGVDLFQYDYGSGPLNAVTHPAAPTLGTEMLGPHTANDIIGKGGSFVIAQKTGLDISPLNVNDENDVNWLRACIWPNDATRHERLNRAVAVARSGNWSVLQYDDCTTAVEDCVRSLPTDVQPVLINTWVLTYLPAEVRRDHIKRMQTLCEQYDMIWLSAEHPTLKIGDASPPPIETPLRPDHAHGSFWTLTRSIEGTSTSSIVARSHPHGVWLEWLIP